MFIKMKPEEVEKALKCCMDKTTTYCCDKCPLYKVNGIENCTEVLSCNAAALLRECRAENEKLTVNMNVYALTVRNLVEENERLMREKTALECVVSTARNQGRSEIITEFEEKLMGRFNICESAMYSETNVRELIARVAKQMKEEKK